jgi:hypothetical protein
MAARSRISPTHGVRPLAHGNSDLFGLRPPDNIAGVTIKDGGLIEKLWYYSLRVLAAQCLFIAIRYSLGGRVRR